jgi:CBS domain containing-hemolysin-like protein
MSLQIPWLQGCQRAPSESWKNVVELAFLIVSLVVLLLLDLTAIAARTAILGAASVQFLAMRERHEPHIERTITLFSELPRLEAALNLTVILTRFLIAGLGLWYVFWQIPTVSFWWIGLGLFLAGWILFGVEWGVSRNVARNPEHWALRLTRFALIVKAILAPLVALPLVITNEPQSPTEVSNEVVEDELKTLVDAGQQGGVFEQGERRMIYSVMELGDTLAREIMVPRIDMLALEVATPFPQAVEALLDSGHSRVPVYEETVDNLLGVLYAKDLLRVWREGTQLDSLRSLLRQAYFVPEVKKVNELLAEMQSQRIHMAIVVDEYGGIAGLVTLEDIVEEVLGEIRDEFDQSEELPYQVVKNGDYIFLGRIDVDDFNEIMGSELPKDEADTLGGYIYSELGHVPTAGEQVEKDNLRLVVEQVNAQRIRKVRARWVEPGEKNNEVGGNVD